MNYEPIRSFKDLNAWKEAHKLVLLIYQVTKEFPKDEQFGLTSQLRRAAVSITSNIAEGFSRHTYKEKAQFYSMALGSLSEVQSQLIIAADLKFIQSTQFSQLDSQTTTVSKLTNGLIKKSKAIIQNS
jgi:four helix bundle protein